MNPAYLFLYGLIITTITITGAILYQKAKNKQETQNINIHFTNWGN